jgi:hypothetical protein
MTLDRIVERDDRTIRHAQPDRRLRRARCGGHAAAMDPAGRGEVAAAAMAGKGGAGGEQLLQRAVVQGLPPALPHHRCIGRQAEGGKGAQLFAGGTRDLSRWIQVLDADPPFAPRMPGQQPAAERRQQ